MIFTLRNAKRDIQTTPISGAAGGEGQCYRIHRMKGHSVKIYTDPVRTDLDFGLKYFIANPPSSILEQIAWPLDIVESGHYEVKGYLQNHFSPKFQSFTALMSSLTRPRWATASFIQNSLQQVAHLIAELHTYGYLYPDLYSEQILVNQRGTVVLVDAASCQFVDAGTLFPCDKIHPQPQAPELFQGKDWGQVAPDRSRHTDNWSLAVLIFESLMECHPFDGIYIGSGNALPREERIKQGFFPFEYRATHDYRPPRHVRPYRHLDQDIRDLFHRCFVEGHAKDKAYRRPSAGEWSDLLRNTLQSPVSHSQAPRPQTSSYPPFNVAIALRNAWDRATQSVSRIPPRLFTVCVAAILLLVVAIACTRLPLFEPSYPTVDRLRSSSSSNPYPVQFNPSAPPLDTILSRLRGESDTRKDTKR